MQPKYGVPFDGSREVHTIKDADEEVAYCGAQVTKTYWRMKQVKEDLGPHRQMCKKCLTAKHATDSGAGTIGVATTPRR